MSRTMSGTTGCSPGNRLVHPLRHQVLPRSASSTTAGFASSSSRSACPSRECREPASRRSPPLPRVIGIRVDVERPPSRAGKRIRVIAAPTTYPPFTPSALPMGRNQDVTSGRRSRRVLLGAAPRLTRTHRPRVSRPRSTTTFSGKSAVVTGRDLHRSQSGQVGVVAAHAEDPVGDDNDPPSTRPADLLNLLASRLGEVEVPDRCASPFDVVIRQPR